MNLYNDNRYIEDVDYVSNIEIPWELLRDKSIIISGATGLIGSFLVDVLMSKNRKGLNCKIIGLSRNLEKAKERFLKWKDDRLLNVVSYNINSPFVREDIGKVDYVIHMASNTHPILYANDPIGTISTNIIGLQNLLEFAVAHHASRFVFTSSNEIYGENRGDVELFHEDYCGYIDSNTLRAGYPESKRCGEALCQAYMAQKEIDVVIPRFTRSYGPTMLMSDTKAISQFIKKGVFNEDIVLKSEGKQYYSYTYVSDAVSGLLYVMLKGESGKAYNIADEGSDIMLKDLAQIIADIANKHVVFEIPDLMEVKGYSTATKARLDGSKLKLLGWRPKYDIRRGIERTISILKAINNC